MNWVLCAILCGLLVECALRLPFAQVLTNLRRTMGKALYVLSAERVSDHWKEKAMAAYALATMRGSLTLAGFLLLLAAIGLLAISAFDQIFGTFQAFMASWQGVVVSILLASLYLVVRKLYAYLRFSRPSAPSARPSGRTDGGANL